MNNYAVYRLKSNSGLYPYEITVYDPRGKSDPPDWFTDILKLDKIEDGVVRYCSSTDSSGGITYQVPRINGHINIPNGSIVAMNLGNNEIFPIKIDVFNLLYEEKCTKISKFIRMIKRLINKDERE